MAEVDVSDEDVEAAIDALGLSEDDGKYDSIAREDVRRALAQDRARQARCSCGRERLALCWDCDRDAFDGATSQ